MVNPKLKYLEDVPWDNSLKLSNGKTVHGLEQLPMILKFSDEEVFNSHVTLNKNDFANWIRDVVGYAELADKILSIKTKDEFLKFMEQAIFDIKNYSAPESASVPVPVKTPEPINASEIIKISEPVKTVEPVKVPEPATQGASLSASPSVQQPIQPVVSVQPVFQSTVPPIVTLVVEPVAQSVVPPIVQSVVSPVVQPVVQSIVPPIAENSVQPTAQPTIQPTIQQTPSPIVAPIAQPVSPVIQPVNIQVPVQTTVQSVIAKPVQDSSTVEVVPIVPVSAPVQVSTPVSTSNTENTGDLIEEIFDFEEIFKVLITELDQEVLTWDVQTS
jgi:hypothetical protein